MHKRWHPFILNATEQLSFTIKCNSSIDNHIQTIIKSIIINNRYRKKDNSSLLFLTKIYFKSIFI